MAKINSTNADASKQVLLIVFDGWGLREERDHNAIAQANTPFFDHLRETYPHSRLQASGAAVGLPEGESGNSDVGHVTIGAGKVIDTNLVRINKSIESGEIKENKTLQALFEHVKKHNSSLHLHGFVSNGGVHSHIDHLFALMRAANEAGIDKVVIHVLTDGRDTPPKSAVSFLKQLEDFIETLGIGFIATAMGRIYADRDSNWERIDTVEKALYDGKGAVATTEKPSIVIQKLYDSGQIENDQLVEPIVFVDDSGKAYTVADNDAVIYFNYRSDRARMISQRHSERAKTKNILFATMTEYSSEIDSLVLFPPLKIKETLAKAISDAGLTQAHIAETEKFTHLTFFLDGGVEKPWPGEDYILIESRRDVDTHDKAPQMRVKEIVETAIESLNKKINLVIINIANPDMIGHTGNLEATISALETVDVQLKKVVETALENKCTVFITADHGNAEQMQDTTGEKHTYHTDNLVPAIITDNSVTLRDGALSDVAPTILDLFSVTKPDEMTGNSLIVSN
jgi:2,3-bisphosphoglycerate-independent phosphoglycerate mutase